MSLNYDRDYESLKSIIRTGKNNSISAICSLIRENSSVLEFGTSTGYMTRYLNEELNCTVTGVEVCEESSRIAKVFCKAMHCCDIESTDLKSSISDTFDYICFADVLEHLRNPWEALRSIKPLLRPQGKVLISIPNICLSLLMVLQTLWPAKMRPPLFNPPTKAGPWVLNQEEAVQEETL